MGHVSIYIITGEKGLGISFDPPPAHNRVLQGSHPPGKSGKTWKKSCQGERKLGNFFYFSKKLIFYFSTKSGNLFFKMLIVIKLKNVVIFIWKMLRLSLHALRKMSRKMSKIGKDKFVQFMEKVRELFLQIFGGNPVNEMWNVQFTGLK